MPPQMYDDLDYIASRLGVSRSALVTQLLTDIVPDIKSMLEAIPANMTETDLVRFRGKSESIVLERMENLRRMKHDLFSKP